MAKSKTAIRLQRPRTVQKALKGIPIKGSRKSHERANVVARCGPHKVTYLGPAEMHGGPWLQFALLAGGRVWPFGVASEDRHLVTKIKCLLSGKMFCHVLGITCMGLTHATFNDVDYRYYVEFYGFERDDKLAEKQLDHLLAILRECGNYKTIFTAFSKKLRGIAEEHCNTFESSDYY